MDIGALISLLGLPEEAAAGTGEQLTAILRYGMVDFYFGKSGHLLHIRDGSPG